MVSQKNGGGKLLVGQDAIMKYLGIGRKLFDDFVNNKKMPALPPSMTGGKWLAHTENLDDWTRSITRVQPARMIPEREIEES